MGVDMHAVGVRAEVPMPAALAAWHDAPGLLRSHDPWWFAVNWSSMSKLIVEMDTVGVLDEDTPKPEWPKDRPGGAGDEHLVNLDEPDEFGSWEAPVTEIGRAHYERLRAIRYTLGEHGKVPVFKFTSNDSWVITPPECLWIADALEDRVALLEGSWRELVEAFIGYNRRCAAGAGGYRIA